MARTGRSEDKASNLCKNAVAHLIKHNLVRAWESEFDQVTHYEFDQRECLLRLSMARYIVKIGSLYSPLH